MNMQHQQLKQPNVNYNLNSLQSLIQTQPNLLSTVLQNQACQGFDQQSLAQLLQQQQAQRASQTNNLTNILQLMQTNPLLATQLLAQQRQADTNPNLALLQQLAAQNQTQDHVNQGNVDGKSFSAKIVVYFLFLVNHLALLLSQNDASASNAAHKGPSSYDEVLKRQQDSQQTLSAAVAAVQQQQPRLSAQNSSNSLINAPISIDTPQSSANVSMDSPTQKSAPPPHNRQASSDRLLSGSESVQDHISRLISENEAIVEPNPVLLKRRPYHRQSTSNSISSQPSEPVGRKCKFSVCVVV